MQHKIERKHIWSLITLNLACDDAFEMRAHSFSCYFAYQEIVRCLVWREESDVGYIAFVS